MGLQLTPVDMNKNTCPAGNVQHGEHAAPPEPHGAHPREPHRAAFAEWLVCSRAVRERGPCRCPGPRTGAGGGQDWARVIWASSSF